MLKTNTYILAIGLATTLFSCSQASEDSNPNDSVEENQTEVVEETQTQTEESEGTDSDSAQATEDGDEISSRYNYDQDFEVFKTAVINKDIKGVSAFASSDIIDAEMLVDAFQDPDFLAALKKAKYEDLEVDDSGDEVLLVFSCLVEGSDDEGNTYESGLYLYFSQGDPSLLLENFLAAG